MGSAALLIKSRPSDTDIFSFQVVFEAVMINSNNALYMGDIAIDDVSIDIGVCPPSPTTASNILFINS